MESLGEVVRRGRDAFGTRGRVGILYTPETQRLDPVCHSDRSEAERRNLAANGVHAWSMARCFDCAALRSA